MALARWECEPAVTVRAAGAVLAKSRPLLACPAITTGGGDHDTWQVHSGRQGGSVLMSSLGDPIARGQSLAGVEAQGSLFSQAISVAAPTPAGRCLTRECRRENTTLPVFHQNDTYPCP